MSKIFDKTFKTFTNRIEFNPEWSDGTGYFNHAVRGNFAPKLIPGAWASSIEQCGDTDDHDGMKVTRRIIFIGTIFGNIVVFERYCKVDSPIVVRMPMEIQNLVLEYFGSGFQSEDQLTFLFGYKDDWFANLGKRLSEVIKAANAIKE